MLDNSDGHTKTTLPQGIIACSCNAVQTCDVTDRNVAIRCPFEICSTHNNEKMRGPHFHMVCKIFDTRIKIATVSGQIATVSGQIATVSSQNCCSYRSKLLQLADMTSLL